MIKIEVEDSWDEDYEMSVSRETFQEMINYLKNRKDYRFVSKQTRYEVLRRQGWTCNNCGVKLNFSKKHKFEGEVAHIDHIFPFSKREEYFNGSKNINEISNLQALCESCNKKKMVDIK